MAELIEKLRESLGDRYDVEREIGEGGMAVVFLARDVRHDRRVAIKVLHEDLGAALGADRFRREIQIATSLTHPHILTLYDSGEAAGSLFYVMPFIEGESLRQRIDREQQMPIDKALKITGEVASALDYAHRKGVIHRDIKPENILLEDGHAIVADFGIARAVSTMGDAGGALTKTGMSLGTPTYMSPEQAFAEKDLDGRSDLYSLACVLYEMLVGQPPFTGANAQAVMARHSMAEVPSMQIVRATIPDEVEDVVMRALAKSPADRFATVAEFAEELQECVIDYHTTTRRAVGDRRGAVRVPPGRRTGELAAVRPWWKRRAVLAAASLGAVAGLGGIGWALLSGGSRGAAVGDLDPAKVAVMYFEDVSASEQLDYLADGLTEALIQRLSEVQAITVVSKDGVEPFRNTSATTDSVAAVLSVGTIVRGTVEEAGQGFRIKVRLIDGNSGDQKVSASFDQASASIVEAQDSLAVKVAEMLRTHIGGEIALRDARAGTRNTAAWTLYQRGQRLRKDADRFARESDFTAANRDYTRADSLFAAAAGMDNSWAQPLVAQAEISLARAQNTESAVEARPWVEKGIAQADAIIARLPREAGAFETRGNLRYLAWAYSLANNPRERLALLSGAEADLKKTVEIDRTRASAWNSLSTVHSQQDNSIGAKTAALRAYEEDAFLTAADEVLWKLYATSYDLQQFSDAVKYCEDGTRRFPDKPQFVRCRLWLLTVKSVPPNVDTAWKDYARLVQLTPPQNRKLAELQARMLVSAGLARAGELDSARRVIASARPSPEDDKEGQLAGIEAFIRTLFGTPQDTAEAFAILNRYVSSNPQHRAGLAESQSWWWTGLKADSRFGELVAGAR